MGVKPRGIKMWGKKKSGSKKSGGKEQVRVKKKLEVKKKNSLFISISDTKCHHGTMVQPHDYKQLYAGSNPVRGKSHL